MHSRPLVGTCWHTQQAWPWASAMACHSAKDKPYLARVAAEGTRSFGGAAAGAVDFSTASSQKKKNASCSTVAP